jgi:hypothetical protein
VITREQFAPGQASNAVGPVTPTICSSPLFSHPFRTPLALSDSRQRQLASAESGTRHSCLLGMTWPDFIQQALLPCRVGQWRCLSSRRASSLAPRLTDDLRQNNPLSFLFQPEFNHVESVVKNQLRPIAKPTGIPAYWLLSRRRFLPSRFDKSFRRRPCFARPRGGERVSRSRWLTTDPCLSGLTFQSLDRTECCLVTSSFGRMPSQAGSAAVQKRDYPKRR